MTSELVVLLYNCYFVFLLLSCNHLSSLTQKKERKNIIRKFLFICNDIVPPHHLLVGGGLRHWPELWLSSLHVSPPTKPESEARQWSNSLASLDAWPTELITSSDNKQVYISVPWMAWHSEGGHPWIEATYSLCCVCPCADHSQTLALHLCSYLIQLYTTNPCYFCQCVVWFSI